MNKLTNNLRNLQAGYYKDGALDKPILLVAADHIESLEAQLKEREWISVNDEVPAERCLAYTPNDQDVGIQWRIIPDRLFKQVASDATHWMPLSSPPQEQDK